MLFTLFVAVLAATLWALRSFYVDAGTNSAPHDASTLELAIMAAITVGTYTWMQRLRAIRQRTLAAPSEPPLPIPVRYAEAVVAAAAEEELEFEALEKAEQVA